ncbi:hypothetical protein OH805_00865 [Streptomyces sp. NBC_00879]|uniref:hypothetical protein n=1 Tax=Streptomyces sp. NBC_00879 TaxID=2975855 RepID=UPI00386D81AA|nr:hypothetical protein OH805_00865 [Streptomyces sp. NBC_00879]
MPTAATGAEDHSLAPLTHAVPDLIDVRQAVDAVLAEFLSAKRRCARSTTRELIDRAPFPESATVALRQLAYATSARRS